MRCFLVVLILFMFSSCNNNKDQESFLFVDLTSDIAAPKHYIIAKNNEQMVIDGIADEPSWQTSTFTDSFIDIEGVKIPKYDTKIKMLWDENYFYVYAQMAEPHIWGNLKQRDTVVYFNNDFEVFIAPSGSTRNYCEIEINALGTVWDLLLNKPYRDKGKANNHWNLDGLKSAVHVEGTLNNYRDIDSLWTVEMAIPIAALLELKNSPQLLPIEGEQWRINFSRVEWDFDVINGSYKQKKDNNGNIQPEYNWVWSNQNAINMHEPEKWGIIQFTNKASSKKVLFIADEFMSIKQVAYSLYRQTNGGSLKSLLNEIVGNTRAISAKYSDKDYIGATFFKTNLGFEYKIELPKSKRVFIINETGVLNELKK